MRDKLRNILKESNHEEPQEKLIPYLNNTMLPEERDAFEKSLLEDPFIKDAAEGLGKIDSKELPDITALLNAQLNKQIKRKRKNRRKIGNNLLTYLAIILILLLSVISYVLIIKSTH
jgi:hypothetical protein